MEVLIALAILAAVAAFVTVPLRRRADGEGAGRAETERADLEARKLILYREIRDAESDRAAGKLNDEDFTQLDRELRSEAIEVLKRLDKLDAAPAPEGPAGEG